MELGTVARVYIRQLQVNNLLPISNTEADLILPGEVFQGINQFMQIGYISILIAGLTDADYQSTTFGRSSSAMVASATNGASPGGVTTSSTGSASG